MKVLVTGATGFIGSQVVADLLAAGHEVRGFVRSAEKAAGLGAEVVVGDVTDHAAVVAAMAGVDAVAHLAFNHDFSRFAQNCEEDRALILAMGAALEGRSLIVTSGVAMANVIPGQAAVEDGPVIGTEGHPRAASEIAGRAVGAVLMRLPQVHDRRRFGLVSYLIDLWRREGSVFWTGSGAQRWPAAHVTDVARAYRLALEVGAAGALHPVAEGGVPLRDIAEVAAKRLGLPLAEPRAPEAFGWLAHFVAADLPASSALTRERLGWTPTGPGMLEDLAEASL